MGFVQNLFSAAHRDSNRNPQREQALTAIAEQTEKGELTWHKDVCFGHLSYLACKKVNGVEIDYCFTPAQRYEKRSFYVSERSRGGATVSYPDLWFSLAGERLYSAILAQLAPVFAAEKAKKQGLLDTVKKG